MPGTDKLSVVASRTQLVCVCALRNVMTQLAAGFLKEIIVVWRISSMPCFLIVFIHCILHIVQDAAVEHMRNVSICYLFDSTFTIFFLKK